MPSLQGEALLGYQYVPAWVQQISIFWSTDHKLIHSFIHSGLCRDCKLKHEEWHLQKLEENKQMALMSSPSSAGGSGIPGSQGSVQSAHSGIEPTSTRQQLIEAYKVTL